MKKSDFKRTRKLIKGLAVPTRPSVLLEAIKALNAFAPDPAEAIRAISRDLALSGAVLKAANTELFDLERKVGSIERAVTLLGLKETRKAATKLLMEAPLVGRESEIQKLRRRSAAMGRLTAHLAVVLPKSAAQFQSGYLPLATPGEAYAAGLLHDAGMALLMQRFGEYAQVWTSAKGSRTLSGVEMEQERFGTDHALAGYLLAESWNLPESLCRVIRDHHAGGRFLVGGKKAGEGKAEGVLMALLTLAEHLAGDLSPGEWGRNGEELLDFFGLGSAQVEAMKEDAVRVMAEGKT